VEFAVTGTWPAIAPLPGLENPADAAAPAAPIAPSLGLATALLFALLGGALLNLMPCVFPVLSLKVLGFASHAQDRRLLALGGLAYTAGVVLSFVALAGLLLALRAGGEQLGWGFQLQSPLFVTLLAYVLFVMALSLSGVIVLGGRLAGAGQSLAERSGYTGTFFTGALATVAATPCTAPFMGAAVGYALTQPWTSALLVFEALGLGLALPYLLLTLVPAWRRALPRPGPWMVQLERFLAFPLYASVAWLVWVVTQQAGPVGVAAALGGLVAIAFAAWLYRTSREAGALARRAATGAAVALALAAVGAAALGPGPAGRGPAASGREGGWEAFSPARLAELRAAGTPVFVNVTAAWCITCLVNERVALQSPAVAEAFARKGVVYLKADWTSKSPEIAALLESFGRSGVPLYVVYGRSAAGSPQVLPQILSETGLIEAIDKL
jgi:thiol:disulfide interchange protein DsbD